jgi:hypothetical protein
MQNYRFILIIFLALSSSAYCQTSQNTTDTRKDYNTIYLELGGTSFLYGLNYERSFLLVEPKIKINTRIGVANSILVDGTPPIFPAGVSIEFGKNKNNLQINFNRTFDFSGYNSVVEYFSIGAAYVRRIIDEFYFHASVSYLIFDEEQPYWDSSFKSLIWPGIGVGFSF